MLFSSPFMMYVPHLLLLHDLSIFAAQQCLKHPEARRLDIKSFINRPIPRLLRYELLLRGILEETNHMHDDRDSIPQVIEVIKALGKDTEPGVQSAKLKVEVWRFNSNLVFKPGEFTVRCYFSNRLIRL